LDEDKLTFIRVILASASKSLAAPAPPLDELFHTNSGLSPTDKRLADDFQMIGDVNIFLNLRLRFFSQPAWETVLCRPFYPQENGRVKVSLKK
jgi:hypothetical protein